MSQLMGNYPLSEIGKAAFFYAYNDFCRVFWNINQKDWEDHWPEAKIGEVTCRKYYWGEDEGKAELPNLEAFGVSIWWYKYPGRSMSVNRDLTPDQWTEWLRETIISIDEANAQGS